MLIHPLSTGKCRLSSMTWSQCSHVRRWCKLLAEKCLSTNTASTIGLSRVPSSQVRKIFLDFFSSQHNHQLVPSSSVRLLGDPSVLFVNAGMNQFKPIFLGTADPQSPLMAFRRVVNSQKCIRAGGKHNDLDDVGRDCYHHTFFEMLGNWSFADYFKKEACKMAWELLTVHYRIPADRLYVTYFSGDPVTGLDADMECRDIWLEIGVPADRVLPFGSKDNFWDMGETGPCGPCTEIHYNHTGNQQVSHLVNAGSPEVTEIWNLVFMQYERLANKSLVPLPCKHVDTGMGLERLTALLNGSQSNYDTDLFQPLFDTLHKSSKVRPYRGLMEADGGGGIDRAYRVVADHARMAAVTIADGIYPDHLGPEQIVRKVIRRAALLSRNVLKCEPGTVGSVAEQAATILGDAFPDLRKQLLKIVNVVNEEESEFLVQLEKGLHLFEDMAENASITKVFSGQNMFKLCSERGFPEELLVDLIKTRGLTPEMDEFHKLVSTNKELSKMAAASNKKQYDKFVSQQAADKLAGRNVAVTDDSSKYDYIDDGYVLRPLTGTTLALWSNGRFVDAMATGAKGVVILNRTNFYFEAGGQPCDFGRIIQENGTFQVEDVQLLHGFVQHYGTVLDGSIQIGCLGNLDVDQERRFACMQSHTATHILNEILQQMLESCQPRSFYSGPDYLQMDFVLQNKHLLTVEEIGNVEHKMNDIIHQNLSVDRMVLPQAEAVKLPHLKMLESKFYPSKMSVISVGSQAAFHCLEACCGTHVRSTEPIGQFVVTAHKAVAQTQRRIRGAVGTEALKVLSLGEQLTSELQSLKVRFEELVKETPEEEILEEDLVDIDKGIRNIRTDIKNKITPYTVRLRLEPELELLQRLITRKLRPKRRAAAAAAAKKQVSQDGRYSNV